MSSNNQITRLVGTWWGHGGVLCYTRHGSSPSIIIRVTVVQCKGFSSFLNGAVSTSRAKNFSKGVEVGRWCHC